MRTFFLVFFLLPIVCGSSLHAAPALFKSTETPYSDMSRVGKWQNMLARYAEEMKGGTPCATKDYNSCKYPEWRKFIESIRGLEPKAQLNAVNKQMNKSRYTVDSVNWGVEDYWATPGQFLTRSGDCEDYAIIKYMTLKELGCSDKPTIIEYQKWPWWHDALAVSVLVMLWGCTIYILRREGVLAS